MCVIVNNDGSVERRGGEVLAKTHHPITPLGRQNIHRHRQNLRMIRNRTLITRLPYRHHHIRHLCKNTDPAVRKPKGHCRRRVILVPVLDVQACAVQQETVAAGLGVVDEDVRVEPVHEGCFVGLGFGEGGGRVTVAEGPTDERGRVDEGEAAVVHGGVGGVEGVAHEAGLLFGDEDRVGEVQEGVEGGSGGGRLGGRPGGGEV